MEAASISKSKWTGKKAAFIGDSITSGVNTTRIYHEYLQDMIGFGDVYVDGIGGSSYSSLASDDNPPIVSRVSDIPVDRDLIILFGGTNDFSHDTPLGTIADTTDVSFYGAVSQTITDIITAKPSVRLAVMTPLHRARVCFRDEEDKNAHGRVLIEYVNALKEVCMKYSIPVIDAYALSGLTPKIPAVRELFIPDGLHPNAEGHRLLAERIAPIIEMF